MNLFCRNFSIFKNKLLLVGDSFVVVLLLLLLFCFVRDDADCLFVCVSECCASTDADADAVTASASFRL